jgi:predicted kinase
MQPRLPEADMLTVVTGPPCSGKSTYIRGHAHAGDIIIDLDRIALALTTEDTAHHEYSQHVRSAARAARNAAVNYSLAISKNHPSIHAWIIDCAAQPTARAGYRKLGATVVKLDPGMTTCLGRAEAERPPQVTQLIRAWYAAQR